MKNLYSLNKISGHIARTQSGFTLIELMIALTLGLVIVAAATMLFLTGKKSTALQAGMADLQDNANFGLNYLTKDIRLTNLNVIKADVNDQVQYGGIVLTSSANATRDAVVPPATVGEPLSNLYKTITAANAPVNILSRSNGMAVGAAPAWTGVSNVEQTGKDKDGKATTESINSDQLTIQYTPQYVLDDKGTAVTTDDEWVGGFDCEGRELRFPVEKLSPTSTRPFGRQMIVQRYFLRADTNKGNEPNQPLALACEAGFYALAETPAVIKVEGGAPSQNLNTTTFGAGSGQIIMQRVDHFRVLLGVQNDNNYRYISIKDYMGIAAGSRPRILSVQLGLLVRSINSVAKDVIISNDQQFQVLDQLVRVKTPTASAPKYVRQVVSQTIALRNTFGDR